MKREFLDGLIDLPSFNPKSLKFPAAWAGHLPFAAWLINELSPNVFVELGTHTGNSYFSFCQAVKEKKLSTKCFAVDTWQGDDHAGGYGEEIFEAVNEHHESNYSGFSRLLRMTFDEAANTFPDHSIDLLHIDGLHTYEAVKHDFETWLPKMSAGGIILFHDTNVRERGFGVWRLWDELIKFYPYSMEFVHSHGLGVLQVSPSVSGTYCEWLHPDFEYQSRVKSFFASLGDGLIKKLELDESKKRAQDLEVKLFSANKNILFLQEKVTELGAEANHHHHIASRLASENTHFLHQSENLRQQINALLSSNSWQITKPFRFFSRIIKRAVLFFKKILAILLRSLYRHLPFSKSQKVKLKSIFYRSTSFLLQDTASYRNWLLHISAINENNILPAVEANGKYVGRPSLLKSDGVWEWKGYSDFKKNIAEKLNEKNKYESTKLPKIIDIGDEIDLTVSQINLAKNDSKPPEVSIVIPVFNNLKLTLECLLSISKFTSEGNISFEVIVVNDASSDNSLEVLSQISNLKLITNMENLGYLLSCNKAIEQAEGKYVVLLNNDVQVTPGWLSQMRQIFSFNQDAGIVGPKILFPNGVLQEFGALINPDGSAKMLGLGENPNSPKYSYVKSVDYVSGACLMIPAELLRHIGGYSEDFLPCYCEDSDLCYRVKELGYKIYCAPTSIVLHHLSKTTASIDNKFKNKAIQKNLLTLRKKWGRKFSNRGLRSIAFYLPQFHPIPENNEWWGAGFTEWRNVSKAEPNYEGHYQPRVPADLGYYDLRVSDVMRAQVELAIKYGIEGFCFYYYWFDGKRLLERPVENYLNSPDIDFPFCVCWANENWTRRWDGREQEVLISQNHSSDDDRAVIKDLIRYFNDKRYIRIDGKPLVLVYQVDYFPDFKKTSQIWREVCREENIGEIYIAMVETFEFINKTFHPRDYGCDASVEFPPHGMAKSFENDKFKVREDFVGTIADYKSTAINALTRESPDYVRFRGVIPSWDNTARRGNRSYIFENSTPGLFQAWLEVALRLTFEERSGDERIVFINAWNEWAEGAYLEPDIRFGHAYLQAVKNAYDSLDLS